MFRGYVRLRRTIAAASNDGREVFRKGIPSCDSICAGRARNRDTIHRRTGNKDAAKLSSENCDRVRTLETTLQRVPSFNPGIFDNPNLVWNINDTGVDGEFGMLLKVFGSSNTNHGAFTTGSAAGNGHRHLTAVVGASATGQVMPPFFITSIKLLISNWLEPL